MFCLGWESDFAMNIKTTHEIVAMAWCDKTSFDAIYTATGLSEKEVIDLMRITLKPSSFRLWRKRVSGRAAKHSKKSQAARMSSKNDSDPIDSPKNHFSPR